MNKRRVEALIPKAIIALNESKIKKTDDCGKEYIDKKFRSKISSFGAAVTMGSFKSAVAFFSAQNNSDVEREELLVLMYSLYMDYEGNRESEKINAKLILKRVAEANTEILKQMKDFFIDASIAIKLAMNAFELREEKKP